VYVIYLVASGSFSLSLSLCHSAYHKSRVLTLTSVMIWALSNNSFCDLDMCFIRTKDQLGWIEQTIFIITDADGFSDKSHSENIFEKSIGKLGKRYYLVRKVLSRVWWWGVGRVVSIMDILYWVGKLINCYLPKV